MTQAFFIAGTDTGVGKTYVACQLIREYVAQGLKVAAMKPIAAGCELVNGEWQNEDVQLLAAASNVSAPRELVNPYCFKEPIAPHIAAELAGVEIKIDIIESAYQQLTKLADVIIVEGAGGFLVPINKTQTMADVVKALNISVILVVGMKLGCINHTLLTLEAIKARNVSLHRLIPNQIDENMLFYTENVAFVTNSL